MYERLVIWYGVGANSSYILEIQAVLCTPIRCALATRNIVSHIMKPSYG